MFFLRLVVQICNYLRRNTVEDVNIFVIITQVDLSTNINLYYI